MPRKPNLPRQDGSVVIKRTANRRFYSSNPSQYLRLDDILKLFHDGVDLVIVDMATGVDITDSILKQAIILRERGPEALLSDRFLSCLIATCGTPTWGLVPAFLQLALDAFIDHQTLYRSYLTELRRLTGQIAVDEPAVKLFFNDFFRTAMVNLENAVSPDSEANQTMSLDQASAKAAPLELKASAKQASDG